MKQFKSRSKLLNGKKNTVVYSVWLKAIEPEVDLRPVLIGWFQSGDQNASRS